MAVTLKKIKVKTKSKLLLNWLTLRKQLWKKLDRVFDSENIRVNIGGGQFFVRHWQTLDYVSDHYNYFLNCIDYNFNLTAGNPLPFKDNSVEFFYASHTFEHIPQQFCQTIFNELYHCLKPGGAIRLTQPDFDKGYDAYKNNRREFFKKYPGETIEQQFLDFFATYMKTKVTPEELREKFNQLNPEELANYFTEQIPLESQSENPGFHINWWNQNKATQMLNTARFRTVYASNALDSQFEAMQVSGRRKYGVITGFDCTHPEISMFIEAVKS